MSKSSIYADVDFDEIKDQIARTESGEIGYNAVVYDTLSKDGVKNAAGIQKPKPITDMTLGEVSDYQEKVVRPLSRQYGLSNKERQEKLRAQGFKDDPGSTGIGRYQFERSTLVSVAEKEFGPDWKNQRFTPEIQDQLARRLWNDVRGNEQLAKNTWVAATNFRRSTDATKSSYTPLSAKTSTNITDKGSTNITDTGFGLSGGIAAAATIGSALTSVLGGGGGDARIGAQDNPIGTLMNISRWGSFSKKPYRAPPIRRRRLSADPRYLGPTIRFKDLRKKVYEQMIMNESLEKEDK